MKFLFEFVEEAHLEGRGHPGFRHLEFDVAADVSPLVAQSQGLSLVLDAVVGRDLLLCLGSVHAAYYYPDAELLQSHS